MLVIELKSWQQQDGTFARVKPNFRVVCGPPGCSIVILIANRTVSSLNRFHSYEGFARIYRIFNTGIWDYRLFNFVATFDSSTGRRKWNLNVGFRGGNDGDPEEEEEGDNFGIHCSLNEVRPHVRRRLVDQKDGASDGASTSQNYMDEN